MSMQAIGWSVSEALTHARFSRCERAFAKFWWNDGESVWHLNGNLNACTGTFTVCTTARVHDWHNSSQLPLTTCVLPGVCCTYKALLSLSHADEEEEVEEDTRSSVSLSRLPSRETHITDMRLSRSLSTNKKKAILKKILFVSFVILLGFLVILFTIVAHTLSPEDQVDTCQNVESGRYLFDPFTNQENFRLCHSKEARLTGRLGQAITGLEGTSVNRQRQWSVHVLTYPVGSVCRGGWVVWYSFTYHNTSPKQ